MQLNDGVCVASCLSTLESDEIELKSTSDEATGTEVTNKRKLSGAWSFMSNPTKKDILGSRKFSKAFDAPKKPFDHLIVLDFEWTCDDAKFGPPEIIEFPSVLLSGHYPFNFASEIQHYVRPRINPKLTDFCKNLTAITQTQVDNGCDLRETLHLYESWLRNNRLIGKNSYDSRSGANSTAQPPTFCIITWGDSDIGTILKEQCKRSDIELPAYFHEWINLKSLFKQHFGWEPRGGLQNVVERCGCAFEGRAHSGLVDSRNTAKIVQKMLQEGFRFTRATRNIHAYKPR